MVHVQEIRVRLPLYPPHIVGMNEIDLSEHSTRSPRIHPEESKPARNRIKRLVHLTNNVCVSAWDTYMRVSKWTANNCNFVWASYSSSARGHLVICFHCPTPNERTALLNWYEETIFTPLERMTLRNDSNPLWFYKLATKTLHHGSIENIYVPCCNKATKVTPIE